MRGLPTHRTILYFISLLLALACLVLAAKSRTHLSNFTITDSSGHAQSIELPLSAQSALSPQDFIVKGDISFGRFASHRIKVIPDDTVLQVRVNGDPVDLAARAKGGLSDFVRGFTLDLKGVVHQGTNAIEIKLRDRGGVGLYGLHIQSTVPSSLIFYGFAAVFLMLPLALVLLGKCRVPRGHALAYFLVLVGVVIQVVVIWMFNPVDHVWSDAQRHWSQGLDLLRIDLMSTTDPIMYQIYIAILAKLSLNIPALVAFYTSLLAVITPWLWYRFLRELVSSKGLALAGWALLSLLPSWTAIYSYFMQETLLLPLLGAALWATWRCRRKQTQASFVLMVLFWVLVGLTRGIAIPMAAVVCTWLWLAQDKKWTKAIGSLAVLVLILGPLTYRSYQTVNQFAPHGMGHLASIYAMSGKREIVLQSRRNGAVWTHTFGSPSTGAEPFAPFSDWKTQRTGKVVVKVDLMQGSKGWEESYKDVAMDLKKFAWVTKENLIFLFFASSWPDNNMQRIVDQASAVMRWLWAPGALVCLVLLVVYRRRMEGQWMLPAVLLAWFLVQGLLPISVNEGRYRKPFEGLLIAQYILLIGACRGQVRSVMPSVLGAQIAACRAILQAKFARKREAQPPEAQSGE